MAKTSKTIPQKEKASSSRSSGNKAPVEPPPHEYVPGPCVTKDAVLRPSSGEEGTKSPVPKPGKDKKRKVVSRSEDLKPKTRRVRRKEITLSMDSVQRLREEEEALALVAISKFRADLSQCEVEIQKVSGERDALRLLCGQKDEVIRDLQVDLAKAREEEAKLDKQVAELAKCRYRRETLEEIHARGFDLAEEIKRAKELKVDAKALASDSDDDDDEDDDGSKSGPITGGDPGGEETALDDNPEA
ncbi:uncharacterized protein [Nicotiana tomentosiformis]|uniref:uncharacterized protein n=1 Tax=Nicotiana tomentosiformis TaxID=4098 RepID=UPI00388CE34B